MDIKKGNNYINPPISVCRLIQIEDAEIHPVKSFTCAIDHTQLNQELVLKPEHMCKTLIISLVNFRVGYAYLKGNFGKEHMGLESQNVRSYL